MTALAKVSKAIGAAIGAGAGAVVLANQAGGITAEEWGGIIGTVLVTAFVTYFAPANKT